METQIKKRVQAKKIVNLFNDHAEKVNIRYFQPIDLKEGDYNEDNYYTYKILIRHNEEENPKKIFEDAISSLEKNTFNKLKETHEKIRAVLINYNIEEYGDCIIDEISEAVGIKPTTVYYEE